MSNILKIRTVGAELFYADGRKHDAANRRSSQFRERAQLYICTYQHLVFNLRASFSVLFVSS
jgi:hypothetical protein